MTTQNLPMYAILAAMLQGERYTVQKAFRIFHTTELHKIVSRLRRKGYDIRAERQTRETADGRKVTFHEYYIPCAS